MTATSKFFSARKIAENTTMISGLARENAYLLEGLECALLIDTLCGAGNLAAFCRELTDLPIYVVLTHGHVDHSGGCYDFKECSIHPLDICIMYASGSIERRQNFISRFGGPVFATQDIFTSPTAVRTYPVFTADCFDLGSRIVEVIGVPGHSAGSITILDRDIRVLFSGDACNTNTLLYLDGSTSVREYRQSLAGLNAFRGEFDWLWGGHNGDPLPPSVIDEAIGLCERIMDGSDSSEEGGKIHGVPYYYATPRDQNDGPLANIAYRKDWILDAPRYYQAPMPSTRGKE